MNQPLDPFPTSPQYPSDDRTPGYWPDYDQRPPRRHYPRKYPAPIQLPRAPGMELWDDNLRYA